MQRTFLTLLACLTLSSTMSAQDEWDIGVNYVIWVADQSGKVFKNQPVSAMVGYKDRDNNVLYREAHTGTTNELGNLSIKVGKGEPLEGTLSLDVFKAIAFLYYSLSVDIGGNKEVISGENPVFAVPRSHVAGCALTALNAWAFGGIQWGGIIVPFGQMICPPDGYSYYFTNICDDGVRGEDMQFVSTPITDIIRARTAPGGSPSGAEIPYLNIGAGLGKPMYCGPDPTYISAMHGIRMANIGNLLYGAELIVQNYDADHPTYALLCQNQNADGGAIVAGSPDLGVVGVGSGGGQFQSTGTGSGYGVYGLSTAAADNGEFKYGVAGTDGGFAVNYAGYFNGMSYTSAPFMTGSDARWKREVKSESGSLSLINKLHPSTYVFVENTPYSLPRGIQHGFLAQELETVLPELVADIVHPTTFDPSAMKKTETATYKAVNYDGLISILTAGIQELDAKVVQQQSEMTEMKEMISQLTARIAELEK